LAGFEAVFNVKITGTMTVEYYRALSDIGESQLRKGFEHAMRYFIPEYGVKMPVPAMIREWALSYHPDIEQPPVEYFVDESTNEDRQDYADTLLAELRQKLADGGFSMPKPQADDYYEHARQTQLAKNGGTQVPSDPDVRRIWAKDTAKKQGWVQ
jgi:hypothetical protein